MACNDKIIFHNLDISSVNHKSFLPIKGKLIGRMKNDTLLDSLDNMYSATAICCSTIFTDMPRSDSSDWMKDGEELMVFKNYYMRCKVSYLNLMSDGNSIYTIYIPACIQRVYSRSKTQWIEWRKNYFWQTLNYEEKFTLDSDCWFFCQGTEEVNSLEQNA